VKESARGGKLGARVRKGQKAGNDRRERKRDRESERKRRVRSSPPAAAVRLLKIAVSYKSSMYVYYCRTYEKAVSGGGEREKGGHVLRDTTSRGLFVRVWPPHTSERRGGGGGRRRGRRVEC
jgi:hypothetical protein